MISRKSHFDSAPEHTVAARWTRIGASFNVAPAGQTPDIERLLLDTIRQTSANSRLFIIAATWLVQYADYIAKRRLAVLVRDELQAEYRPIMGFLLDWVQSHARRHRSRFREAIRECHSSATPGPLLNISRRNAIFVKLAEQTASPLSRKWGCWMEEFTPKFNSLRPPEWIAEHNPSLLIRAISSGDLVSTIAADVTEGKESFPSESNLARKYHASRASVRAALLKLKLAGYAQQSTHGKSRPIIVSAKQR